MATAFPPLDGSASKRQEFTEAPPMGIDPNKRYTATLDTYAVVYQVGATSEGGGNATLGVRYLDVVERRDGAWRIRHRRTELCFMV